MIDKEVLSDLGLLSKTAKIVLKALAGKTRKLKSHILDVTNLKADIQRERGIKLDRDEYEEFWVELSHAGGGEYTPREGTNTHARFKPNGDLLKLAQMALSRSKATPKQARFNHKNPSTVSTTGTTFRLANDIVKALPQLSEDEVEFLANLLRSRVQ